MTSVLSGRQESVCEEQKGVTTMDVWSAPAFVFEQVSPVVESVLWEAGFDSSGF